LFHKNFHKKLCCLQVGWGQKKFSLRRKFFADLSLVDLFHIKKKFQGRISRNGKKAPSLSLCAVDVPPIPSAPSRICHFQEKGECEFGRLGFGRLGLVLVIFGKFTLKSYARNTNWWKKHSASKNMVVC
jgi:hypothetical protein